MKQRTPRRLGILDLANFQDPDWLRRQLVACGIAVAFAAVLAAVGAFASDQWDPFQRVGYWTLIFISWAIISRIVVQILSGAEKPGDPGRWKTLVTATIISSIPMLGIVLLATAAVTRWSPNIEDLIEQIIGIWGLGGAYVFLVDRHVRQSPETAFDPVERIPDEIAAEPEIRVGKLLEALPGYRHEDIICLGGEDHYVRVYTRHGNTLVLMRFNDAIEELAGYDGSRVHRSWWVSNDAVINIAREGRTARLDLGSGLTIPVSQPYMADAMSRWAGMIDR